MTRQILIILSLVSLLSIQSVAKASSNGESFEKTWSFGVMGGLTIGANLMTDTTCDDTDFLCFGGLESLYYNYPLMTLTEYRFHERWSFRGALGIEIFPKGGVYYSDMPRVFPAGETSFLFHLIKKDSVFHPYLIAGMRFPVANLKGGIGNQFYLGENAYLFAEFNMSGMFGLDFKTEGLLGFMYRF